VTVVKREMRLTYWNPKFPTAELPALHECVKRQLTADGFGTVERNRRRCASASGT